MKEKNEFDVKTETTLLPFLLEHVKGKSRNNIKSLLKREQIVVNGKPCRDFAKTLQPGQKVGILARAAQDAFEMPLPIIYEDGDIIAINKPAGMLSIASEKERAETAYHIVTDYMKAKHGGRIFVVHRLDRETSGVLLFAKNEKIKHALQDDWDSLSSLRSYTAVVEGAISPAEGTVKSWLKQTRTLLVYSSEREGDGKLAITNYKTVKSSNGYSLLDISLDTGRKNQIRVHMNDLGHPIIGDKKYGSRTNPLGRLALHAGRLCVRHPFSSAEMDFSAKTPTEFLRLFK